MQFYFVDEENWTIKIDGSNTDLLVEARLLAAKQSRKTGFLGVLDMTGRIRGSIQWSDYHANAYTKLSDFIRKYKALESLETLSRTIKSDLADGLIESDII